MGQCTSKKSSLRGGNSSLYYGEGTQETQNTIPYQYSPNRKTISNQRDTFLTKQERFRKNLQRKKGDVSLEKYILENQQIQKQKIDMEIENKKPHKNQITFDHLLHSSLQVPMSQSLIFSDDSIQNENYGNKINQQKQI